MPETDDAKLTPKQRKWIAAYVETGNATEAARQAGYGGDDASLASIGSQNLRKLQIPVTERMNALGLDDDTLFRKLLDGLSAEAVVTATFEGAITDEKAFPDFGTRFRYLDMALKLRGKYPSAKAQVEHTGKGGGPIKITEVVAIMPPSDSDDSEADGKDEFDPE